MQPCIFTKWFADMSHADWEYLQNRGTFDLSSLLIAEIIQFVWQKKPSILNIIFIKTDLIIFSHGQVFTFQLFSINQIAPFVGPFHTILLWEMEKWETKIKNKK